MILTINIADQSKIRIKALGCEQLGEERGEEALIKLVVDLASVDTLRHQCRQGIPWYLFWWEVCATLQEKYGFIKSRF